MIRKEELAKAIYLSPDGSCSNKDRARELKSVKDFLAGYDSGFGAAIEMLRSEEAELVGKENSDPMYKPVWGKTLMAGCKWADWLEDKLKE